MAQIFISYSTRNVDFARYLRGLLQDAGFDVWMDETKLSAGQSWTDTLEANVTNCAAFVIIMSPEAKASDWVRRERLLAERLHKPMFPILFSGEAWWDLANIQYEDMRAGMKATLSPRMIEALRFAISGETQVVEAEPAETHSPAPAVAQTESRKLEAAMPAETQAGSDTEVWAKISLPASEGLRGELPAAVPSGDVIQKGDARASTFPIRFPIDTVTGRLMSAQAELRLSAGDFVIAASRERIEVEIPPDSDSRTVIFTLEAKPQGKTSGRSRIVIDLIYEARIIAQISVSTVLVERVTAAVPTWTLAAVGYAAPPGSSAVNEERRGAPAVQPSLSAPPEVASQYRDERERGVSGARQEADFSDDSESALPTYEEAEKKSAPSDDYVPQPSRPQYSGSASRATDMDVFDERVRRQPRRASNTPLRLASLFAALALVFFVALSVTRLNAPPPGTALSATQFALSVSVTPAGIATQLPITGGGGVGDVGIGFTPGGLTFNPSLIDCGSRNLANILKDADVDASVFDSFHSLMSARQSDNFRVVISGRCSPGGADLTLNFELRNTVTPAEIINPQLITITTTSKGLTDERIVRLIRALIEYARGSSDYTALAQTFEDLAASATSADETAALRMLQHNSSYMADHPDILTQVALTQAAG
jgi:hypothetical protein